jgi:gluconolactonase
MKSAIICLALLLTMVASADGQSGKSMLAPGATIDRVFCCGVFLEGPAAAPDGSIYFSDITASFNYENRPRDMIDGVIRRYDPKTGQTSVYQSPSAMANGITFAANGDMYVAHGADLGSRIVTRTDVVTGLAYVSASRYRGRPFNAPNDLAIDRQGRVYFSDPRYLGDESIEQPVLGIYRIDTDGSIHLVAADIGKPNGLALSPDGKTLYAASVGSTETDVLPDSLPTRSTLEALVAYEVRPDGSLGPARVLVDFAARRLTQVRVGPDGLDTDSDGNVWATHFDWKAVIVFSPAGEEVGRIPLPEGAANLEFGRGTDADVLYIAGGTGLYRTRVRARGWHVGDRGVLPR